MNHQQGQPWDSRGGGAPSGQSRASVDYSEESYPHSTIDTQEIAKPRAAVEGSSKGKSKKKAIAVDDAEPKNKGEEAARSGRACLACRKLKVRLCDLTQRVRGSVAHSTLFRFADSLRWSRGSAVQALS